MQRESRPFPGPPPKTNMADVCNRSCEARDANGGNVRASEADGQIRLHRTFYSPFNTNPVIGLVTFKDRCGLDEIWVWLPGT